MKTAFLKLCILSVIVLVSCAKENDIAVSTSLTTDTQQLQQLGVEIEAFAKNKACTGNDCRVVPMGAKKCGGPSQYLVYSLTTVEEKKLLEKITQYTELQKKINDQSNSMSDCLLVVAPTIECVNGQCTVKK
jgi:hypothetical protein